MFRLHTKTSKVVLMPILALCFLLKPGWSQDALPIGVHFEFREPAVDTRFDEVLKSQVEKEISADLADTYAAHFPFWTFQSTSNSAPASAQIWISLKSSVWSLNISLTHAAGKIIPDRWSTVLYAPGDLDVQVLPKNRAWRAKIKSAFDNLLHSEKQTEMLTAFQEFVPLGSQMAEVPAQTSAVLPLDFQKYQTLSMSSFRILCDWSGHGIVVLHSTGTGSANDFTPDAPQFKGIWVVHNRWEFAGTPDDIANHVGDLPGLKARAFYLEQFNSPPPDLSVAPN